MFFFFLSYTFVEANLQERSKTRTSASQNPWYIGTLYKRNKVCNYSFRINIKQIHLLFITVESYFSL